MSADSEDWLDSIFDAVVSDVQRSGYFDQVNEHEPKRAPQGRTKLSAAIWVQSIAPIGSISGSATTSARIVFIVRMYHNMITGQPDLMERRLLKATSNLIRRYHDDFDFEGMIRNIDLLGAYGISLSANAGYVEHDKVNFRVMDLLVPCLVNDVWPQVN